MLPDGSLLNKIVIKWQFCLTAQYPKHTCTCISAPACIRHQLDPSPPSHRSYQRFSFPRCQYLVLHRNDSGPALIMAAAQLSCRACHEILVQVNGLSALCNCSNLLFHQFYISAISFIWAVCWWDSYPAQDFCYKKIIIINYTVTIK